MAEKRLAVRIFSVFRDKISPLAVFPFMQIASVIFLLIKYSACVVIKRKFRDREKTAAKSCIVVLVRLFPQCLLAVADEDATFLFGCFPS